MEKRLKKSDGREKSLARKIGRKEGPSLIPGGDISINQGESGVSIKRKKILTHSKKGGGVISVWKGRVKEVRGKKGPP